MRVSQVITPGGVAVSPWLPLEQYAPGGPADGLFTLVSGAATYGLEVTPDNIQDPAVTPTAYALAAPFAPGATANASGVLPFQARAIRVNQTVGAGTVQLKVVTRGLG